jgi:diguanylate cyclase (GGDEF)-like protein
VHRIDPAGLRRWSSASPSPGLVLLLCVLGTLVLAVGDYFSGPYLVFATFFLVPVATSAWFCGRAAGLVVSTEAAVAGVVTTAADPQAITPAIYLTNGVLRFVMYAAVCVVLANERQATETIRSLATTDPLTGLLNRRAFYQHASSEMERARRNQQEVAMIYIDVDDLKARNDTYGHEAGDAMIVEFAEAARATLRTTDLVARVGGDEFVMMLCDVDQLTAEHAVERLRTRLENAELLPIRFSAGIVAGPVVADEPVDVERILHAADVLMMQAKGSGKARTVVGHAALDPSPFAGRDGTRG